MVFSLFAGTITPPLNWGLRDELLSRKAIAPKLRKLRSFSCRHCLPTPPKTIDGIPEDEKRDCHRFDFDGIRSHLKSRCVNLSAAFICKLLISSMRRHGVKYIADEDFFPARDP